MFASSSTKEDEKLNAYDSDLEEEQHQQEGGDEEDLLLDDFSLDGSGEDASSQQQHQADLVTLRIKSFKDTEISVPSSSTVASVKNAVRRALQVSPHRYMRLIVRGRLLAPDSELLSTFMVKDGDVVHAVIAAEGQQGGAQALLANSTIASSLSSLSRRALRGTGLSSTGQAIRTPHSEEDEEETTEDDEEEGLGHSHSQSSVNHSAALIRHRGFDRLRLTMGLRRSQVAVLRAYFNPHIDRWARNNPERARQLVADIDDALLRRRIHEEAWMATQGPGSEFRINLSGSNSLDGLFPGAGTASPLLGNGMRAGTGVRNMTVVGTDRDFFWGFVLGFFVGFLMLLWVWVPTVPHKQKLGILTGISFQLALGVMKSADDYSDDTGVLD